LWKVFTFEFGKYFDWQAIKRFLPLKTYYYGFLLYMIIALFSGKFATVPVVNRFV
jgi:hypothetical protein